jgi:hypothetical protein
MATQQGYVINEETIEEVELSSEITQLFASVETWLGNHRVASAVVLSSIELVRNDLFASHITRQRCYGKLRRKCNFPVLFGITNSHNTTQ